MLLQDGAPKENNLGVFLGVAKKFDGTFVDT